MIHNLTSPDMLLGATILLLLLVTLRAILLRRAADRTADQLETISQTLLAAQTENIRLQQVEKRFQTFKTDLNQAELTTKMQRPRLRRSCYGEDQRTPERYQYIHSLTSKGVKTGDIAAILSISSREADQLVTLASLVRQ